MTKSTFLALLTYVPDMESRRVPHRAAHLERLALLRRDRVVEFAAGYADPLDGGVLVLRADAVEEVEQLVEEDPYSRAGLICGLTIRRVVPVVPEP